MEDAKLLLDANILFSEDMNQNLIQQGFLQNQTPNTTPVFREVSHEEFNSDENEETHKQIQTWTRDLTELPNISHNHVKNYLLHETVDIDNRARGASKHKTLGYQLFKENYVKSIRVKPNVCAAKKLFVIKCFVCASMKRVKYDVYVHLSQDSGSVEYAKCTCKAGAGGCCKHVAAVLYQLVDYNISETKFVPDDKIVLMFYNSGMFQARRTTRMLYFSPP